METELRSDVSSGVIVKVLRKGYRQQDRVLRYAEVVVARALDVQASASPAQAVKSSGERFGEVTGTSQVPVT
jgi:hypothetical protein